MQVVFWTKYNGVGSSFPFYMGMLFLIWKELGMGKFPHSWLSSHSETEFLHSRLRRSWRNTLSLFLLSHSWGNFPSLILSRWEITFSCWKENLNQAQKRISIYYFIAYYPTLSSNFIIINLCLAVNYLLYHCKKYQVKGTYRLHLTCRIQFCNKIVTT